MQKQRPDIVRREDILEILRRGERYSKNVMVALTYYTAPGTGVGAYIPITYAEQSIIEQAASLNVPRQKLEYGPSTLHHFTSKATQRLSDLSMRAHDQDRTVPHVHANGILHALVQSTTVPQHFNTHFALSGFGVQKHLARTTLQGPDVHAIHGTDHGEPIEHGYDAAALSLLLDLFADDTWIPLLKYFDEMQRSILYNYHGRNHVFMFATYFKLWMMSIAHEVSQDFDLSIPVSWNRPLIVDAIVEESRHQANWLMELMRLAAAAV